jgi:hypothetical protein
VERIDLYRLYVIGSEVHPLLAASRSDTTVGDLFLPCWSAERAVGELLSPDGPVRLDFCRPAAEKLQREIKALTGKYYKDADGTIAFAYPAKQPIQSYELWGLKTALEAFETVFQTEMQRAATYLVPKRGIYDLGELVDRADAAFPDEIKGVIGEQCLIEYRAAGRCFAFGLYTASGYHCCRAAEAVLRQYYSFLTEKADKGTESWGDLIATLENTKGLREPDKKTLGHIRHLKDHERNPLSHLRANLGATDADVLLSASKVAISAMALELLKKKFEIEPKLALVVSNEQAG